MAGTKGYEEAVLTHELRVSSKLSPKCSGRSGMTLAKTVPLAQSGSATAEPSTARTMLGSHKACMVIIALRKKRKPLVLFLESLIDPNHHHSYV